MKTKLILITAFIALLINFSVTSAYSQAMTTVAKILAERDTTTKDPKKPKYCSGGVFKPCVCWQDATKRVMYRPSVRECGGKAAIILHGTYAGAFSAVLRNRENADRIPNPAIQTVNGCTKALASSAAPPNKCSLFKAQKVIKTSDDRGNVAVHCMGTKGTSSFGMTARRITIKLADVPNATTDPLVRVCLRGPDKNLN